MKPVIFTRHAIDRLRGRGISEEIVKEVLTDPDRIDLGDERPVAQKLVNGKLIRVIYEEERDAIVVVSAYRTSKVAKYLRSE
jgi:hypothetical protein